MVFVDVAIGLPVGNPLEVGYILHCTASVGEPTFDSISFMEVTFNDQLVVAAVNVCPAYGTEDTLLPKYCGDTKLSVNCWSICSPEIGFSAVVAHVEVVTDESR